MNNICVQINGVTKAFDGPKGSSIALKDINLEIKSGEFVSLIGHSGCGKSTLLNMIAGLYQPTEGEILVEGKKVEGPGPDRAMVFQQYSLLPWLSVRQNVFEAVDALRDDLAWQDKNKLVEKFLTKVGLIAHADKKPHQISGGMKQRVAIARAFAVHPKVMLLDEPFGALDALTKGSLHEELLRMWSNDSETKNVIMVTHDIDEAIFLSDRIVVMTNGPEATVGEIIEVPIPRPRDKRAILHTREWTETKERLLYLLTEAYSHREEVAA
ncbi:MAG TPA: ABC transporter ATP-binding protein [Abditibacteriaceae bacterium]|jgi:nitrate ABC transporter ATP-binding subunit